jgi:transaldolase/glucose-6-phosphate isomerase
LDYIHRQAIENGDLARLIQDDGIRGMTSNPAIFEKAIGSGHHYDAFLKQNLDAPDAKTLFDRIAVRDIQDAAALLKGVYDRSGGADGFVSIEVSPYLARDAEGTLHEARELWKAVNRPNVMIKVPGTAECVPVIAKLLGEGININITLLFAVEAYEKVAHAYLDGLEHFTRAGGDPKRLASVASFFVSRIDSAVDALAEKKLASSGDLDKRLIHDRIVGKTAIANAKVAYERYEAIFKGPRWDALKAKGARVQRLLWASTGTKNPSYRDVLYVEELIGPETVDTMPPATVDAFRDHGRCARTLDQNRQEAHESMAALSQVGIDFAAVTAKLLEDGIQLFADAFDKLLGAVEKKRREALGARLDGARYHLSPDHEKKLAALTDTWRKEGRGRRLWARDASLWTGKDEAKWLGWLDIRGTLSTDLYEELAREGKQFEQVCLIGMGGSSLGPEVLGATFGKPKLHVLDSTDPEQVAAVEKALDLDKTLFVVSSKSGGTLEPNILKAYFFEKVKAKRGAAEAGRRFVAVTDPGSSLEKAARAEGFRHIVHGYSSIGGRYSVLSPFGLVPAALIGIDLPRFLERTRLMVGSCAASVPPEENPGIKLGLLLGLLAKEGRDKLTIITSPEYASLGAWLEQLVAESTGKLGKGIIPVDGEKLGAPGDYGADRVFVFIGKNEGAKELAASGQPVVEILVSDAEAIGQEFFRWEIATAVAGAVLGINPFDQPDVEASKVATRRLTDEYEKTRKLPAENPFFTENGVQLFADPSNVAELKKLAKDESLRGYLEAHLSRLGKGDYLALLAYLPMGSETIAPLQSWRLTVRDRKQVATCLGFGPRFLHSTGQAYKGGPGSGVFLQITRAVREDLPVPGQAYTFGIVEAAQARGDFEVLAERKRRALRIHLPGKNLARELSDLSK